MNIQRLILQDFRNLRVCDVSPGAGINILCGENGQGKTNFLESIYLLSHLAPLRPVALKNLILSGSSAGKIRGHIQSQGVQKELSLLLRKQSKVVKVNGKGVSRGVDYFGELAVVLFSPASLKLIQGGPAYRRRFMDTAISTLDRRYLYDLKDYKRVLEQRNRLLRLAREGRVSRSSLKAWSEQLVNTGSRILAKRLDYLSGLAQTCAAVHRGLSGKRGEVKTHYRSSLFRRHRESDACLEQDRLREQFLEGLVLVEDKEIRSGVGQIGPHLDDVDFVLPSGPAKTFASQGEQRILALSLTLSQAILYHDKKGFYPVLLLDDVNSELDLRHQKALSESLQRLGQVFVATTDKKLYQEMAPRPRIFHVTKGEIFLVKNG
jgi:DNA replication and repair protein RecF